MKRLSALFLICLVHSLVHDFAAAQNEQKLKPDQTAVAHYTSDDSLNWRFVPSAKRKVTARYRMIIAQQPTYQKVKRPAPGGEGYVIDHFNPAAAAFYLGRFKPLFEALDTLRAYNFSINLDLFQKHCRRIMLETYAYN